MDVSILFAWLVCFHVSASNSLQALFKLNLEYVAVPGECSPAGMHLLNVLDGVNAVLFII